MYQNINININMLMSRCGTLVQWINAVNGVKGQNIKCALNDMSKKLNYDMITRWDEYE